MGFTFWNEWHKNIDLFHDIQFFLDVPVYSVGEIYALKSLISVLITVKSTLITVIYYKKYLIELECQSNWPLLWYAECIFLLFKIQSCQKQLTHFIYAIQQNKNVHHSFKI